MGCRGMCYWCMGRRRTCARRTSDGHRGSCWTWCRWMQPGPPQGRFGRRFLCGFLCGGSRFGVGNTLQVMPDFFRNIDGDRAGMRFLFGYAKSRKKVNDGFGFDLEFAGELVDADLGCVTHASLGTFLFLLFRGSLRLRGCSGRGGSLGGRFFGIGIGFSGGLRLWLSPG